MQNEKLSAKGQQEATPPKPTLKYTRGRIADILRIYQQRQATGILHVKAIVADEVFHRAIAFRDGSIVYAGHAIPTPYEFVTELTQYTHIGVLDTVLAFATKRSSIQNVMQAMVQIGVLQWPAIARATREQAIAILEELCPTAGRYYFENGLLGFDLQLDDGVTGFTLDALLPASEPRKREEVSGAPTNERVNGTRPVVLCVDDSPVVRALVQRILAQDYTFLSCHHAFAAQEILNSREDISILLLDLTLPDVDGLDFCSTLRKIERYQELPIVMLTARDGVLEQARGRFVGATCYLTKPVDPIALKATVAQYTV